MAAALVLSWFVLGNLLFDDEPLKGDYPGPNIGKGIGPESPQPIDPP